MRKLTPVEDAKTLFNQAKDWSVWQWLTEKKRARTTADAAWEALEDCEEKVIAAWPPEWQKAYHSHRANGLDAEIRADLELLRQADEEAHEARDAAESQFDEADRCMSASMACEGSQMAIDAWVLREKVIRKAEAMLRRK
jgi:hypothetical protein